MKCQCSSFIHGRKIVKTLLPLYLLLFIGLAVRPTLSTAGEWGLGAAIAYYQPPHNGVESESISLPFVSYQSERLNINLRAFSYRLFKFDEMQISLEGEIRLEGYDPDGNIALTGMEKRNPSLDAGVSVARNDAWGEMIFMILADMTETHEGYEARLLYQIPYRLKRLIFISAVGVGWLDNALVDYYYGVRLDEVSSTRSYYAGLSTTNTFVELSIGYDISDSLEFSAGLKVMHLGKSIEASPIVDKKYDTSAISSLQYRF